MGSQLSVLVPLYVYPSALTGSWLPLTDQIASAPGLSFNVIVNPHSGPGDYPPNIDYIAGLHNLSAYSNVKAIGYVDTAYGNRELSAIEADIDTYAKWAGDPEVNVAVAGIFFDDVTNNNTAFNTSLLQNATSYAKTALASSGNVQVFLNTGYYAPAQYFTFADAVVQYENNYTTYGNASTIDPIPGSQRAKSVILVTKVPVGETDKMNQYIHYMHQSNIGYVWYTVDGGYTDLSEAARVVSGVQNA